MATLGRGDPMDDEDGGTGKRLGQFVTQASDRNRGPYRSARPSDTSGVSSLRWKSLLAGQRRCRVSAAVAAGRERDAQERDTLRDEDILVLEDRAMRKGKPCGPTGDERPGHRCR